MRTFKIFPLSLRNRLFLSFGLLTLSILMIFSLIEIFGIPKTKYLGQYKRSRVQALQALNLVADLKKKWFLQWLDEWRDDVVTISMSPIRPHLAELLRVTGRDEGTRNDGRVPPGYLRADENYQEIQAYLRVIQDTHASYESIEIADLQSGRIVVSSREEDVGGYLPEEVLSKSLGPFEDESVTIQKEPKHSLKLVISHAIDISSVDGQGREKVAVLRMLINIDRIIKPLFHTGGGLGRTGEVVLVDQDGKLLNPLKFALADGSRAEPLHYRILAKPALLAAGGDEGSTMSKDYRGVNVLAAYRHIRLSPEIGWGMVVKEDRSELFADYDRRLIDLVFLTVVVLLLSGFLASYFAGIFTGPIQRLVDVAEKVQKGDLSVTLPDDRSGEAGVLGRAFNSMMRRIRDWHQSLEEEVKVRTVELDQKNMELTNEVEIREKTETELEENNLDLNRVNEKLVKALRESHDQKEEISTLLESSRVILEKHEFPNALQSMFHIFKGLIGAQVGSVDLLNEEGEVGEVFLHNEEEVFSTVGSRLPMPIRGLRREALRTGQVVYHNQYEALEEDAIPFAVPGARENALFAPLVLQQQIVGFLGFFNKPGGFAEKDVRLAKIFGEHSAIALHNFRTLEALEKNEKLYRSTVGTAVDAIICIDQEGRIFTWNQAAEKIFGYRESEAIGTSVTFIMPVRFHKEHREGMRRLVEGGTPKILGKTVALQGLRKNGEEFPLELSLSQWQIRKALFFTGIVRDLTERKTLENQFLQAQKMESIGRFAGGIAHDFNNLLTAILGYSDLFLFQHSPGDADYENIEVIRETAKRAVQLTRQLLTISKKQVLEPVVLNVNEVIHGMRDILAPMLGEELKLRIELEQDLRLIKADSGQIEQVILNLVINARDAISDGGEIAITSRNVLLEDEDTLTHLDMKPGDYVLLSISDTGSGMSPETLEHLFEPFFTTKQEGTGLGLSTVYGIVRQMGGNIFVYSEPGSGTTFKLYFPIIAEGNRESSGPLSDQEKGLPRGGETLLIIEDDERILGLCRHFLPELGYTVLAAGDGEEALERVRDFPGEVDLVLTDVIMPGKRGPEVAEELCQANPQLKVIFMSGYADDRVAQIKIEQKQAFFLSKPFTVSALALKIREACDEHSRECKSTD